jgi:hypothetical protein
MITRRTTLDEALGEIESGALLGVTTIVVNGQWWQHLASHAQSGFRNRCARIGVELRADGAISRHFVELATSRDDPPLSTERPV